MRFIKMRIKRTRGEGKTHYAYPEPFYSAGKVRVLLYESAMNANAKIARDRNKDDEHILVGVNDDDVAEFLKAEGYEKDGFTYGAEEIDLATMKSIGDAYTSQMIKITDENKVIQLCAKAALGQALSQEEKDALDPEKDAPGIVKTKKFSVRLEEILADGSDKT